MVEYRGSFFEVRALVEPFVSGDAPSPLLIYVPGDRADALLMQRSVRENIALPFSARPRAWGPIDLRQERIRADDAIRRLQIDTRAQSEVRRLSGGNQQKVTLARWIAAGSRTVLCFDPTRGIDIRTKHQIYPLLRELAGQDVSVLFYTSELDEIRLVCDRTIVIFGGRIVDVLPLERADEASLMRAAHGLPRQMRPCLRQTKPRPKPGFKSIVRGRFTI